MTRRPMTPPRPSSAGKPANGSRPSSPRGPRSSAPARPRSKAKIAPTLQHWKADADLAGIRDEKELAKLPGEERAAFKQLWNDVDQLLTKAAGSK